jgi:hypothetical protein
LARRRRPAGDLRRRAGRLSAADDLYGLPLDRFVTERDRLAKALRAEGRREDATAVAALRKPSVAAWAVNQLVRTQRSDIDDLFGAGQALREAQSALLAGGRGTGHDLRDAMQQERAAAEKLVGAARGLLSSEGHELSPAVVERVADTLHAAALSDEAREAISEGRLERELRHVGLGVDVGSAPAPAPARTPGAAPASKRGEDAKRAADAQRAERERTEARTAARAAEADARRRAERARRALSTAHERRDKAARALGEADSVLDEARAEAEAATREHDRTRAELDAT